MLCSGAGSRVVSGCKVLEPGSLAYGYGVSTSATARCSSRNSSPTARCPSASVGGFEAPGRLDKDRLQAGLSCCAFEAEVTVGLANERLSVDQCTLLARRCCFHRVSQHGPPGPSRLVRRNSSKDTTALDLCRRHPGRVHASLPRGTCSQRRDVQSKTLDRPKGEQCCAQALQAPRTAAHASLAQGMSFQSGGQMRYPSWAGSCPCGCLYRRR